MKNLKKYLTLLPLILVMGAFAQNTKDSNTVNDESLLSKPKKIKFNSSYVVLSYLGYTNLPTNLKEDAGNNRCFSLYEMFNLLKHPKWFDVSIGLSSEFYNLNSNAISWQFDNNSKMATSSLVNKDTLNKVKSVFIYLNIPVMLEFKCCPHAKSPFEFWAGGKVGYLIYGDNKYVIGDVKVKTTTTKNINLIDYGVLGGVSWKFIGIFGTYNFSNLFNSTNAPDTKSWTAGITLTF